ncbi:MAG: hypothetical protein ACMXYE_03545 [Candidatus Woesearchaeota archaeon]
MSQLRRNDKELHKLLTTQGSNYLEDSKLQERFHLDDYCILQGVSVHIEDSFAPINVDEFIDVLFPDTGSNQYRRGVKLMLKNMPFGLIKLNGERQLLGVRNVSDGKGNYSVLRGGVYGLSSGMTDSLFPQRHNGAWFWGTRNPRKCVLTFYGFLESSHPEYSTADILDQARDELYNTSLD